MKRIAILLAAVLWCVAASADELSQNRSVMRDILKVVASDIEKNFYDPNLKGLKWSQLVENARQKIENAKSVNEMEAAIYELAEQIDDSHTVFIPPLGTMEAKYGFNAKPYGNEVRVYEIKPKSSAEKAGLLEGDRVVTVQGNPVDRNTFERMFVYTRRIYMVSPLVLGIERDGKLMNIEITPKFTKRPVVINQFANYNDIWSLVVEAETEELEHPFYYGMQDRIGYMKLRDFPVEGGDFLRGLAEKLDGAQAIVLDLPGCPGGTIESLALFDGMFEDQEIELANTISRKKTEPIKVKPQKPQLRVPLFILVDGATASAAEVVSYHLRAAKKAILIGDDTAGMVTAAKTFEENVGGGAVIGFATIVAYGRLVLPGGVELEGKSIKPDVRCLPTQKEMRDRNDRCLHEAFDLARKAIARPATLADSSK